MHFTSDPFSIAAVTEQLINDIGASGGPPAALANIEIVVTEAINNIVEHAYQEKPDQPIELSARALDDYICFDLTDRGMQMPDCQIPAPVGDRALDVVADLPEGGFGWHLIRCLAENLKYTRIAGKNCLSFCVTIDPSEKAV